MKKIILSIAFGVLFLFGSCPVNAVENLGGFSIDSYDAEINLAEDGGILVEEKIVVDFSEDRHGIYREIPYKYKDDKGFSYNLRMKFISVEDEQGKAWQYEESRAGGSYVLKIGHPDYFVSGKQIYNIKYEVERGIRFFNDHSEIYWNPIGTAWPTTIGKATSIVNLSRDVNLSESDLTCFVGPVGSQSQDCSARIISPTSISFSSNSPLNVYEGMTIAIKFPADYIPAPSFFKKLGYFMIDNFGFFLPILVFVLMYCIWKKRGKEIDLNKTSLVQYEAPDKLTPGEMGYLLKEKYTSKFVAADIVNLAVKGYLKIKEEDSKIEKFKYFSRFAIIFIFIIFLPFYFYAKSSGGFSVFLFILAIFFMIVLVKFKFGVLRNIKSNKYSLVSLKDWKNSNLTEHEKAILKGLFGEEINKTVKLSNLKTFYKDVSAARDDVKTKIKELNYFKKSIYNNVALYFVTAFVIMFLGIILSSALVRLDFFIGLFLSAVIVVFFGVYMSKRTQAGAEALWHAKGFREYIDKAEKYRIKFEEKENIFFEILPYAMVFGLADKWAEVFKGIINKNPEWYESKDSSRFSPVILASALNSFSNQASAASHAPLLSSSSSGFSGGSSGGGFGGGGGGSW